MNASIPGAPWLTGYIAMLVGLGITLLIQSSNVFTVTLTPLAGAGLLELHRAYPLTLGSNLGTTTTGLMAALAVDGDRLRDSLQIALCHTVFNICGILLFYPIPFMRWPLPMATLLGETVAKYR
jgi:sodium-dependent phosphate cotransporter